MVPSTDTYNLILSSLEGENTASFDFADQSILSDLFPNRWVALPYIYNALKTLRWQNVHHWIWRDEEVKNIHYLLTPKPWDETEEFKKTPWDGEKRQGRDPANEWWWDVSRRRWEEEKGRGIDDGF